MPTIESKRIKVETPAREEPVGVEAGSIELTGGNYMNLTDINDVIHQIIQPKHPNKKIKWVAKEVAKFRHLGWQYLKLVSGGGDVEETADKEAADCTTGNILCWRDVAIERKFEEQEKRRLDQMNELSRSGDDGAVKSLNSSFGGQGLKFVPDKGL